MKLIPCTPADAPQLRALAEQTYRDTFGPPNKQSDIDAYTKTAFSLQQVERELSNPHSHFLTAHRDGQTIGYLKLNHAPAQTDLHDPTSLEVERIFVLQPFHGTGAGKHLLDYAIHYAEAQELSYIWLGVWEKNPRAIAFYKKHGFYHFSQHLYQLGQDSQLDYLMRKDLP